MTRTIVSTGILILIFLGCHLLGSEAPKATNNPPEIPKTISPPAGATNVLLYANLHWTCEDSDRDYLTYDVYLSKDEPPKTEVSKEQEETIYFPQRLTPNTKYYWKVVAKDKHGGVSPSPVFSFTTEEGTGSFLRFDGVDDFVMVFQNITLEPESAITVEAWIYPDSKEPWHNRLNRILRKAAGYNDGYALTWDFNNDGRIHFAVDLFSQGKGMHVQDNHLNEVYLNDWHHIAAVYSAEHSASLYIDGILKKALPTLGPMSHTDDLYIGGFGPQENFAGMIDEVRIWNVERTEDEIRSSMYKKLSGNETNLVAYWDFNEGEGQIARDSSKNNNDGQLGAMPDEDESDPIWVHFDAAPKDE